MNATIVRIDRADSEQMYYTLVGVLSEDVIGHKLSIFSALGRLLFFPQVGVLFHECTFSLRDPTHGLCTHIHKSRVRFYKDDYVMRDVHAVFCPIRLHACTRTHARPHARPHARTHARTHAHTHARTYVRAHTHTAVAAAIQVIAIRWIGRPTVTARSTVATMPVAGH